jgi:hypothetical protein
MAGVLAFRSASGDWDIYTAAVGCRSTESDGHSDSSDI